MAAVKKSAKRSASKRSAASKRPARTPAPVRRPPAREEVLIEIPKRARRIITPEQMKQCGEVLSRASGGRPIVFTFDDRVVAVATSIIKDRPPRSGRAGGSSFGPWRSRPRVPADMQREWRERGVDLERSVERARAITGLQRSFQDFFNRGMYAEAEVIQRAIAAERRGVDTRDWTLPYDVVSRGHAGHASARKAKAPAAPAEEPEPRTAEKALSEALSDLFHNVDFEDEDHAIVIAPSKDAREHTFEGGQEGRTSYSFTVTYPSEILTIRNVEVPLAPLKKALTKSGFDPLLARRDSKATILCSALPLLRTIARDTRVEHHRIPRELRIEMHELVSEKSQQHTTAFGRDGEEIKLPEYPTVYSKWKFRAERTEVGNLKVEGDKLVVPMVTVWEVDADSWSYDPEKLGVNW